MWHLTLLVFALSDVLPELLHTRTMLSHGASAENEIMRIFTSNAVFALLPRLFPCHDRPAIRSLLAEGPIFCAAAILIAPLPMGAPLHARSFVVVFLGDGNIEFTVGAL